MRRPGKIGRAELEVLHYVQDHHPVSVREVAEHFAEKKGQVRTTILNVMERLRKKGFLVRKKSSGIYRYLPRHSKAELARQLIGDFVKRTLGGSISPFMAYLAEEGKIGKEELRQLKRLVRELDQQNKGERG
jgi:predicted transcriptional regulator